MAKQTSRELVLERRKALSQNGKNASLSISTPNRVRTFSDSRASREETSSVNPKRVINRTNNNSSPSTSLKSSSKKSFHKSAVNQPSRQLVIERREALSKRGKSADRSKDRTRVDIEKNKSQETFADNKNNSVNLSSDSEQKAKENQTKNLNINRTSMSLSTSKRNNERRLTTKKRAITSSSRAFVLARRESLSKHGKSAGKQPTSAASVARQGDPDLTTREIAQRVRELRSKSGSTGTNRSSVTRPCGPNKNGAKQNSPAEDAHWKVGSSETSSGQVVTGTQANRSTKTTGNEASTCRSITGTQYLGAEVIDTFCQSKSTAISQPPKVGITKTTHGNRVTGNEVGRSQKVTGDEPGTCKSLTGTEYISANQSNEYCGSVIPSPSKIGLSKTIDGLKISGSMTGRSQLVTGDEAGANKSLTGDQYLGTDPLPEGRPAQKVGNLRTVRGNGVTGTDVSRKHQVTGNEAGSCKRVTGDEYVGAGQFESFCGGSPTPEASKVGLSLTNKSKNVSGTMTGRSQLVTGDEPGTCKAITGTPYAGIEQASDWCDSKDTNEIKQRTPQRLGTPGARLTGQQPGIGGKMTGANKGACENLTGTPYIGGDQLNENCGISATSGNSFAQDEENKSSASWTSFSIQSPARTAHTEKIANSGVTGTSYEDNSKITGPFDMAANKVTGTEQFRFDKKHLTSTSKSEEVLSEKEGEGRPASRITGEGQSAGLNITGDDWARGERVTGTEGTSARRRNPTRPGAMNAMPENPIKRNDEIAKPDFLITGSSGNTQQGQLVTFSGGARG
tara:strand:+ start:392 stop:2767 length:2376 start_codon:yes stop_codon:yes gene_type:complete